MRFAELVGTLSLATDAGMGMPLERGLRAAAIAVRLADVAGTPEFVRRDAYYLSLLRYSGCTAESNLASDVLGDEVGARGAMYGADFGSSRDLLPRVARFVLDSKGILRGLPRIVPTLAQM